MIVLDASALVDIVADRPGKDAALEHLAQQEVLAPGHQLAEVASAISRLVRAGELTPAEGERALGDASTLMQDVVPIDGRLLMRAFALRESIRVLDGLYVAVAERYRCPVLTTDHRLARSNPPCDVIEA